MKAKLTQLGPEATPLPGCLLPGRWKIRKRRSMTAEPTSSQRPGSIGHSCYKLHWSCVVRAQFLSDCKNQKALDWGNIQDDSIFSEKDERVERPRISVVLLNNKANC